jgi:hypothetical protein
MSGTTLRDGFEQLVADEPPLQMTVGPVLATGTRLRVRRRLSYAAGSLGVVSVVTAVVVVPLALAHHDTAKLNIAPVATAPHTNAETLALNREQQRVADAIKQASPQGWTIDMEADRWDGTNLEGTANDGSGDGRLMLGWVTKNGSYQRHPCSDSEYRQGATCTERTLADGSVLSLRGVVNAKGIEYLDVTLTHPNGTGISAESGNFTLTWPLPNRVTADDKARLLHVSRTHPTYTVDQLGDVVLAVDRVLPS